MSSTEEEGDMQWLPPPGIHEPYKLLDTLTLQQFNQRAASQRHQPIVSCEGRHVTFNDDQPMDRCPYYSTPTEGNAVHIITHRQPGTDANETYTCNLLEQGLVWFTSNSPYHIETAVMSPDHKYLLVAFSRESDIFAVIIDVVLDKVIGDLEVEREDGHVYFFNQLLVTPGLNMVVILLKKMPLEMTQSLDMLNRFEIYVFQKDNTSCSGSMTGSKFIKKYQQTQIEGMMIEGPGMGYLPGQTTSMYCLANMRDRTLLAQLGFDKRWACGGKRVPWREHPSYNNCNHFSTMAMTSKIKIMSSDHSGVRPCDNFVFHFEDLEELSSVMDTDTPVVIKYLLSSDQTHVLVIFHGSDMVSHVGVIFNVTNKDIFGYYVVSSQAQFPVQQLKQFMLGESRNTLSLVVERQYSDMTLFTRQQFEVWSFSRNSKHTHRFDALHVHNSLAAAMRLHGPLFTAVPGQGVDMYCVAFFKDSYRLKNLYGSYFIALINMVRNRYLRVVGPDSAGIRDMEASLRAAHFQHLEASPCGTYLAVTYERFPGFQLQMCLFDTLSLTLVHSIQLPLYMGRLEGLLSAACCANTRVTFSHCSSRMSIFFQPNRDAMQQPAYIYVKVYQLPIAVTLANICKFQLLRSLTRMEIAQLPLPESMKGFVLSTKPQPSEEDYIETNCGLRMA